MKVLIIVLLLASCSSIFPQSQELKDLVNKSYNAIQSKASDYYNYGLANMNAGNYRAAISAFNDCILLSSNNANAYYYRGVCKCNLGQYQGGISDFNSAIKCRNRFGEAYRERGMAKAALGNYSGACADFRKASKMGAYADDLISQYCR